MSILLVAKILKATTIMVDNPIANRRYDMRSENN